MFYNVLNKPKCFKKNTHTYSLVALAVLAVISMSAHAEEGDKKNTDDDEAIEEITVIGKKVSFANNITSEDMIKQQSSMTSALAVIDNLPGVLVNEGDTFGTDDWSTTLSIRGFQLSLDEQQIGITIDGIANGNSNYGGGAKANRYIDTENLKTVEVSQGTADIASRSNEALGGTLNFTTIDPDSSESMTVSYTAGSFLAQKFFARYETGEILPETYAWVSVSSSENSDWIQQTAQNVRTNIAGKFISNINDVNLTGYISYDDAHEDNYQRVSLKQFNHNPESDGLTNEWTGVPYIDQLYRRGWSTLRENFFGYLKADFSVGDVEVSTNVYYHDNSGRGDWVPPYVVDVTNDGVGNPQSELGYNNNVNGGPFLGRLYFVDANGVSLSPNIGCQSSITFPYGGAGPEFDPACYGTGAIPVGSYRHTHYGKTRKGFNGDFKWEADFKDVGNALRGGIWYEDYLRKESRDWHKIIDSRTNFDYDHTPYWTQYSREFPVTTTMLYLDDSVDLDNITVHFGVKKFNVSLERKDKFANTSVSVDSNSDILLSGGVVADLPIDGLQFFAGYAENFAAIKDEVLERDASALANISPETATNKDLGLRFESDSVKASISYYDIKFDNRLTFIAPDSPDGIDFLIGTNGSYINVGGVNSKGIEASVTYYANEALSIYASYTNNDSTYSGGSIGFPSGNTVFGSVEDMKVISVNWHKGKYFAGLSNKWVGERWLDAANKDRVPAYTVGDLYAGMSLGSVGDLNDVELRLTVNNLFDESYLGGIAGGGAWIGAKRTSALNIKANF